MKLLFLNILILVLIINFSYADTNLPNKDKDKNQKVKGDKKVRPTNKKHKFINPVLYRNEVMKVLQKNHTYKMAVNEKMNEDFMGSKGVERKKDAFINYFGFLRDSSLKANRKVFKKESRKFLN